MSAQNENESSRGNRAGEAYEKLRDLIESGKIPSGERITEHGASERLGLGRGPVREAMLRLQADGLIHQPSSGSCRVVDFKEYDSPEMLIAREELRQFILAGAAELATLSMNGRHIARLGEITEQFAKADNEEDRKNALATFWSHLVKNCGNTLYLQVFTEYRLHEPSRMEPKNRAKVEAHISGPLYQNGWIKEVAKSIAAHEARHAAELIVQVLGNRIAILRNTLLDQ